jgi:hypothetical protein
MIAIIVAGDFGAGEDRHLFRIINRNDSHHLNQPCQPVALKKQLFQLL